MLARTWRMNACTSRFERGSRPVVGSSSSITTGEVRNDRATAIFCCCPRERWLIGSSARSHSNPSRSRMPGSRRLISLRRKAVHPAEEQQVLDRRHVPEERRVRRHAVDQRPDLRRVSHDVEAEDASLAGVRQQQRAHDADERALAGAVGAEHAVDLAAPHRERHVAEHMRRAFAVARPAAAAGAGSRTRRRSICLRLSFRSRAYSSRSPV